MQRLRALAERPTVEFGSVFGFVRDVCVTKKRLDSPCQVRALPCRIKPARTRCGGSPSILRKISPTSVVLVSILSGMFCFPLEVSAVAMRAWSWSKHSVSLFQLRWFLLRARPHCLRPLRLVELWCVVVKQVLEIKMSRNHPEPLCRAVPGRARYGILECLCAVRFTWSLSDRQV